MPGKLDGKVALITGGTSGIGLATAQRFVAEGAYVFITGRRQPELEAAITLIGPMSFGIRSDSSNLTDLDRLYDTIRQRKGRLDVLFANAGIYEFVPFTQVTETHFDTLFNTNVKGLLFTVQKALSLLTDGGSIILNASVVASKGLESVSVYSATKAAVRSFARTWTTDLKSRKIRVNAVSPGPVATGGFERVAGGKDAARHVQAGMAAGIPLGRVGEADEIARAVVFLASEDSSFITGIELFVDGGLAQI